MANHEIWVALALLLGLLTGVGEASARQISITTAPIDFDELTGGGTSIGELRFIAGLALTSRANDFGGFSGLLLSQDGDRLLAVGDRGVWLRARLERDSKGRIIALSEIRLDAMRGLDGRPVSVARRTHDAEALARASNGEILVAFERRNRILRYPVGVDLATARPKSLPWDRPLARLGGADGIEALAVLGSGAIVALAEHLKGPDGHFIGWLAGPGGGSPEELRYGATGSFKPTGMARLDDDELLVLERRFSMIGGFSSRVVRLSPGAARPGALLSGREVGRLEAPGLTDNFEGIAVRARADGAHDVYLLSDDNFTILQRTLLLQFVLSR